MRELMIEAVDSDVHRFRSGQCEALDPGAIAIGTQILLLETVKAYTLGDGPECVRLDCSQRREIQIERPEVGAALDITIYVYTW